LKTRIDALAAVSPYLTTDRMMMNRKTKSLVWFLPDDVLVVVRYSAAAGSYREVRPEGAIGAGYPGG
jgi:hypothetical protein